MSWWIWDEVSLFFARGYIGTVSQSVFATSVLRG